MDKVNLWAKKYEGIIRVVETTTLLLTFIAAFFIGIFQYSINKELLELNYVVSLSVEPHQPEFPGEIGLRMLNTGDAYITYYQTIIGYIRENVEINTTDAKTSGVIPNDGRWYPVLDNTGKTIEDAFQKLAGENNNTDLPLRIFFKDSKNRKYVFIATISKNRLDHTRILYTINSARYEKFDWKEK